MTNRKVWDALPGDECELRLMADGMLGLEKEYPRKFLKCAEMARPRTRIARIERLQKMQANLFTDTGRRGCPNCSRIVASLHGATASTIADWRDEITGANA